jgi:LmbE family N-acetylglucosaminyl deacetylase
MVSLGDAVIVVAHPDDEILWFSSIAKKCKKIIFCFGPSARSNQPWDPGRAELIANYPLTNAQFLNIAESDAYMTGLWTHPRETEDGLQLRYPNARYSQNSTKLERELTAAIKHEKLVFTHNPWGEYGNEEHVQVYRILERIRRTGNFDLYVDSHVSNRSIALMLQRAGTLESPMILGTERAFALAIKQTYLRRNCWTWPESHEWPEYEAFYKVRANLNATVQRPMNCSTTPPLNYIYEERFNRSLVAQFLAQKFPQPAKSIINRMRLMGSLAAGKTIPRE